MRRRIILSLLCTLLALPAAAAELSGVLDVRAVHSDTSQSWTRAGLGKSRYDDASDGLRLGQGILGMQQDLGGALSAAAVLNADDRRSKVVDLQEAWLAWDPLPAGAWRLRAKAGAFFPQMNMEIDYDRLTWTPTRTLSAAAINSWVGEELRTKGLEFTLSHLGRASGSPHDFHFTAAAFTGNDPAGTLIAWRGWGVGDRITGLSESLRLPDLPVYRADGPIWKQTRNIRLFEEVDGRLGYYASAEWHMRGTAEVAVMHYDNRGDPLRVIDGQYSWTTRFDHLGARLHDVAGWELIFQGMAGSTMMGPRAVDARYRAWYLLASHALAAGRATLRYDRFNMSQKDIVPQDPNDEHGSALALAWSWEFAPQTSLVAEWLQVRSERPARALLGAAPRQDERSLTLAVRRVF